MKMNKRPNVEYRRHLIIEKIHRTWKEQPHLDLGEVLEMVSEETKLSVRTLRRYLKSRITIH